MSMTQCSAWMAIPHSWMSCESAEPTRVCSWDHREDTVTTCARFIVRAAVRVQYLQVVDQKLVEGGVGVQVDQETLVVHHSDAGGLQGDTQTLQLPLPLLQEAQIMRI